MKNVAKVVYAILTVVFKVPALETIISVIGDSNVVLSTICKVFYAFAIGAAIVKGLAKVNEFIHPNKKSHMKNANKAMKRTRGSRKVVTILLSIIGAEALLVSVLCITDKETHDFSRELLSFCLSLHLQRDENPAQAQQKSNLLRCLCKDRGELTPRTFHRARRSSNGILRHCRKVRSCHRHPL